MFITDYNYCKCTLKINVSRTFVTVNKSIIKDHAKLKIMYLQAQLINSDTSLCRQSK